MGFTTDYSVLVHRLKFHLDQFSQTPQGTRFTKLIKNWDKTYGYGYEYIEIKFDLLNKMVTTANDKLRQAPGYNKGDDILDGRTTETSLQPLGLSGQEMSKNRFFTGVNSAPDIDD